VSFVRVGGRVGGEDGARDSATSGGGSATVASMFIGHPAVGFASTRLAPRTPLVWLVTAPIFLDLLWPLFLVTGLESVKIQPGYTVVTPLDLHDYPYSHSLAAAVVWSLLFAAAYLAFPAHRDDRRGALVLGLGVFSHWILDWLTHAPDMPLWPGSRTLVGLGLWNSLPGTLAVEVSLFVVGVGLYARGSRPLRPAGTIALWSFVGLLSFIYVGAIFGPPPPSVGVLKGMSLILWILVPWSAWIGRTRVLTAAPATRG
jgi:membrane-bound metal-dependent hydrolase YbcI (DUF457 family)